MAQAQMKFAAEKLYKLLGEDLNKLIEADLGKEVSDNSIRKLEIIKSIIDGDNKTTETLLAKSGKENHTLLGRELDSDDNLLKFTILDIAAFIENKAAVKSILTWIGTDSASILFWSVYKDPVMLALSKFSLFALLYKSENLEIASEILSSFNGSCKRTSLTLDDKFLEAITTFDVSQSYQTKFLNTVLLHIEEQVQKDSFILNLVSYAKKAGAHDSNILEKPAIVKVLQDNLSERASQYMMNSLLASMEQEKTCEIGPEEEVIIVGEGAEPPAEL